MRKIPGNQSCVYVKDDRLNADFQNKYENNNLYFMNIKDRNLFLAERCLYSLIFISRHNSEMFERFGSSIYFLIKKFSENKDNVYFINIIKNIYPKLTSLAAEIYYTELSRKNG